MLPPEDALAWMDVSTASIFAIALAATPLAPVSVTLSLAGTAVASVAAAAAAAGSVSSGCASAAVHAAS
jgi:hypothetical protein